jgi:hypothetical protein
MLRSEYAQLHSLAGGMSVVNYHMASLGGQKQSFLVLLMECAVHRFMYGRLHVVYEVWSNGVNQRK